MNAIPSTLLILFALVVAAMWFDVRAALWMARLLHARGRALRAARDEYRRVFTAALANRRRTDKLSGDLLSDVHAGAE